MPPGRVARRLNHRGPMVTKDGKNAVTIVWKNASAEDTVRLIVDGAQGAVVEQSVNGLQAGQEREVRFEDVRLKKGQHQLVARIDAGAKVTES